MIKKITIICLFLTFPTILAQSLPCEFSWENVPTASGTKNFVNLGREQPFQGPCYSYAFIAAIETQYQIESDISDPNLNLSEAYLDYKVWGNNNFKEVLVDSVFKIPKETVFLNTFPEGCDDEASCHYAHTMSSCYDSPSGQKSYTVAYDHSGDNKVAVGINCNQPLGDYVTVSNVTELSLASDVQLKEAIYNNGPVIIRVNGSANIKLIRNYGTIDSYHAFTIIGWTDDSKWIVKDSYPDLPHIGETYQNIDLFSTDSPLKSEVTFHQVSGIKYNGNSPTTGPVVKTNPSCDIGLSNLHTDMDVLFLGGYSYSKFWINSVKNVDYWVWEIQNNCLSRNQVDTNNSSSILISPINSGLVSVKVTGYKDGVATFKQKSIYLNNGSGGGGGGEW